MSIFNNGILIKECWEYNSFQGNGFGWVTKAKSEKNRLDSICFNTPTLLKIYCNFTGNSWQLIAVNLQQVIYR